MAEDGTPRWREPGSADGEAANGEVVVTFNQTDPHNFDTDFVYTVRRVDDGAEV